MEDAKLVSVNPTLAQEWLERNKGNRSLRDGVVEKYAADMVADQWTQCVAPIVFYEDGDIADGQHRLWAVVESGKTQTFYVVRGLSREAGLNIDTGSKRTLVDNAKISNVNTHLTAGLVSWCIACESGVSGAARGMSDTAKLIVVEKHLEAGTWAQANGPVGKGIRNAFVGAALMRAWYYEEDKDRLRRFSDVLVSGMTEGMYESAAVALRNYLQVRGPAAATTALWRDSFLKTQNAIKYFMAGKSLTVIKSMKDEAYPLDKPTTKKRGKA